jgi:hypothetical protein
MVFKDGSGYGWGRVFSKFVSQEPSQLRARIGTAIALALIVSGCGYMLPAPVLRVLGYEYYVWEYISGEKAIDRKGKELPDISPEERERVWQKFLRGEPLTGREYYVTMGEKRPDPGEKVIIEESVWSAQPVAKRTSQRPDADEEWEFDWCIVYLYRGRVISLQFKETPDEPKPIYRWSGKVLEVPK